VITIKKDEIEQEITLCGIGQRSVDNKLDKRPVVEFADHFRRRELGPMS